MRRDTERPGRRPAAASADTDAESGLDAAEDRRRSLAALEAMAARGLIPPEEYARRRREIEAQGETDG